MDYYPVARQKNFLFLNPIDSHFIWSFTLLICFWQYDIWLLFLGGRKLNIASRRYKLNIWLLCWQLFLRRQYWWLDFSEVPDFELLLYNCSSYNSPHTLPILLHCSIVSVHEWAKHVGNIYQEYIITTGSSEHEGHSSCPVKACRQLYWAAVI